jgi:hypothetical protein
VILTPRVYLAYGDISDCHNLGKRRDAIGIYRVEARDAAKHTWATNDSPLTRNYAAPKVNRAGIGKPCPSPPIWCELLRWFYSFHPSFHVHEMPNYTQAECGSWIFKYSDSHFYQTTHKFYQHSIQVGSLETPCPIGLWGGESGREEGSGKGQGLRGRCEEPKVEDHTSWIFWDQPYTVCLVLGERALPVRRRQPAAFDGASLKSWTVPSVRDVIGAFFTTQGIS